MHVHSSNASGTGDCPWDRWAHHWLATFRDCANREMRNADSGHDLLHVERVVTNAIRIGNHNRAIAEIVLPAAWLHDCVIVPKNSPQRSQASRLAAERAGVLLDQVGYPGHLHDAILHSIEAHSFSAGIEPRTLEAKVVQDADRLEALGALGLARCLMTGGALGQSLFDPGEPFPVSRMADDRRNSIDHFFCKLLRLPNSMQTQAGRTEAAARKTVLVQFLKDLAVELNVDPSNLHHALKLHSPA